MLPGVPVIADLLYESPKSTFPLLYQRGGAKQAFNPALDELSTCF